MKKYIFLLCLASMLFLFAIPVSAEENAESYISEFKDIIPENLKGVADDGEAIIEKFSLKELLSEVFTSLVGEKGEIYSFSLMLIGSVALFSLASNCHESFAKQTRGAVGTVISFSIFPFISSALSSVGQSLSHLSSFFAALTPIAVGITALGGGASTAGVQASGMYTTLTVIGGVGGKVFLFLSTFGLAIALLSSLGNSYAVSVGKGIKSVFTWLVGIFTTLITAVFSIQTLVASAADSAAMRTAKYMASGLIPVVGSAVSGALSTLASGLAYAKTVVGGGAIAVVLSLVISPLVLLLLYRFTLTLATNFADLSGADGAAAVFTAYRYVLDMTVAIYVLSVLVYLFQLILFLKIGVALL